MWLGVHSSAIAPTCVNVYKMFSASNDSVDEDEGGAHSGSLQSLARCINCFSNHYDQIPAQQEEA